MAWRARRGVRGLRRICISVAKTAGVVEKELFRWERRSGGEWIGEGMVCWWKSKERRGERKVGGIFVEELWGGGGGVLSLIWVVGYEFALIRPFYRNNNKFK